jgi:hypothetical protein
MDQTRVANSFLQLAAAVINDSCISGSAKLFTNREISTAGFLSQLDAIIFSRVDKSLHISVNSDQKGSGINSDFRFSNSSRITLSQLRLLSVSILSGESATCF